MHNYTVWTAAPRVFLLKIAWQTIFTEIYVEISWKQGIELLEKRTINAYWSDKYVYIRDE